MTPKPKPTPETLAAYQSALATNENDLVEAVLRQCMAMAPAFTAAVAAAVDERIRADWGGEADVYVGQRLAGSRPALNRRNQQIMRDWQRGERIDLLVRRYSLSRRRVEQIISAHRITLPATASTTQTPAKPSP